MRSRILVIEDSEAFLGFYGVFFEKAHAGEFVWAAAPGAEQGLRLLAAEGWDAVVLDWVLPGGLSGRAVLRALRSDPRTRDLPVLVVTGHADAGVTVEALEAGADDCVGKPFDADVFLARLRNVLRRRETGKTAASEHGDGALRLLAAAQSQAIIGPLDLELQDAGLHYLLRIVETPEELLAGLSYFKPQVVLCVYPMRGFDGFDALALVRRHDPRLPVIYLVAQAGAGRAMDAARLGASAFIPMDRLSSLGPAILNALRPNRRS